MVIMGSVVNLLMCIKPHFDDSQGPHYTLKVEVSVCLLNSGYVTDSKPIRNPV